MKVIKIPVFTEEFKITLVIGNKSELTKYIYKKTDWDKESVKEKVDECNGSCWSGLPDIHPIITIDGDLPAEDAISTLPHEAAHASDYITDFIGINDVNGEFRGYVISCVMRHFFQKFDVLKKAKKKPSSPNKSS